MNYGQEAIGRLFSFPRGIAVGLLLVYALGSVQGVVIYGDVVIKKHEVVTVHYDYSKKAF